MELSPTPYTPETQIPGTQLIYLRESNRRSNAGKRMVWVRCILHGNEFEVVLSHLKSGHTKGCFQNEKCILHDFIPGNLYPGTEITCVRVVGTRKGQTIVAVCCKHKEFEVALKDLKSGNTKRGCWECGVASRADKQRKSSESILVELKSRWGSETYDYSKAIFYGTHVPVTVICHKTDNNGVEHGGWSVTPHNHMKTGCPKCGDDVGAEKRKFTEKEFKDKVKEVWGDQYDLSELDYITAQGWIYPICPKSGHGKWMTRAYSFLQGHGCPVCSESKGERAIREYLEKMGIAFFQEQTFGGCRNHLPLHFDFFLPDIKTLIEFQGVHHYCPTRFGGINQQVAEENFSKQQERDVLKRQWVADNGFRLIEIPHTIQFDSIPSYLEKLLVI